MDIKSLNNQLKSDKLTGLSDLFTSCFVFDPSVELSEYTIGRDEVMRVDLLMEKLYEYDPKESDTFLSDVDVLLYINNIENPLNLVEGLVIKYPKFSELDRFRFNNTDNDFNEVKDVAKRLSFPNKKTRKDKKREEFTKNGYSLPPVVLETPKDPVQLKDGKFSIGGL